METTTAICPTCGSKLTDGIFKKNQLIPDMTVKLIKEYVPDALDTYCSNCHVEPYNRAKQECETERRQLNYKVEQLIKEIKIVSVHSPLNWDYEVLDMVTGQSTTGTGVLSEFKSSITDFFGMQSGSYNKKIQQGEQLCQVQMRLKCLNFGGNAIVAADIDYAEVGGAQGMLMVCMTGTAIKLKNLEVLGEKTCAKLSELEGVMKRKSYLESISPTIMYS